MKKWWLTQSARINTLSLRERVFLFLSVIACCMALADLLWLSPAQATHKQLTQRFDKQSVELKRARDLLRASARPLDASKAINDELVSVKTRLDSVNQSIHGMLPATADTTPLAQVLVQFLRRHEGLTLVRIAAVAPEIGLSKGMQGSAISPSALPAGITRQGVELTVSGPYPDLMRYVQELEKSVVNARWGSMLLKSDKQVNELTLQLFLMGAQPG